MNRIYKIIYSEARNGYMVVSEFARRHGCSSDHRPVFFSWTGMTAEAAVQSEPLVVTERTR